MKKILLSLLSTVTMLSVATSIQAQETFEVDGIKYEITDASAQTVKIIDNWYTQKDYVLVSSVTHNDITYKVTEIGDYAFASCYITGVVIPEGIEVIGERAFSNSSFTSLELPSTVKSIGVNAFRECKNLKDLVLNEGLTTIDFAAFYTCVSLTEITLPSTLTSMNDAFMGSAFITTIISKIQAPMTITYDTFHPEVYSKAVLLVPAGTKEAYEAVDCWRRFQTITETGTPTALHNTIINEEIQKKILNGQLIIIRDGKTHTVMGAEIK